MSTKPKAEKLGNYILIDPNPENHVIEHEDLFIYASLKAKTSGRTFLTETKNTLDVETLDISSVDLVVSDSYGSNDSDKRQFLTTNWSEIGGSQFSDTYKKGDLEGFGITNIDIKIEGNYIPIVTIDFVDIRGATLFEQGSCSPYGLFFHLPYPIFELTVKGYYGKPVTYYLNLIKFNTKFNSQTGNFEARGEFIGWSYAFLADMLMGFVRCANYMNDGWNAQGRLKQKYDETIKYYDDNNLFDQDDFLSKNNSVNVDGKEIIQPFCWKNELTGSVSCMTLTDLLKKNKDIEEFLGKVKTDDKYVNLSSLTNLRDELVELRGYVDDFIKKLNEPPYKPFLSGPQKLSGVSQYGEVKYEFNSGSTNNDLVTLVKSYFNKPAGSGNGSFSNPAFAIITNKINTIKQKSVGVDGKCGGDYVKLGSQTSINGGLTGCQEIGTKGNDGYDKFLEELKNEPWINISTGVPFINTVGTQYIDLGYLYKIIDDDLNSVSKLVETDKESVKNAIDEGILEILGFRPTIRNVFTILCCNVENFVQLLLDASVKAEEYHTTQQYDNYTKGSEYFNDIRGKSEDKPKVFPWPTYYKNVIKNKIEETKETYPGEEPKFQGWWEVKFVEDFIKACERVNKEDEELFGDIKGLPGYDNYTPINPLESKLMDPNEGRVQLKYKELTSSTDNGNIGDIVKKYIGERMFVTLDFSYYDPLRLNLNNFNLGLSGPNKKSWFHPQYFTATSDSETTIPKILGRIDAHNLISCIDDSSTLENISISLNNGNFIENIKNSLGITVVNSGEVYQDFRYNLVGGVDNESYYDTLEGVLNKNFVDQLTKNYWVYKPDNGRIKFLGSGSAGDLGRENTTNTVYIYSDIRKMKQDHLFKLLTQEDYNLIQSITYNQEPEETTKRKEELNKNLVNSIEGYLKTSSFSQTYIKYDTDPTTKLIYFNGDDDDNGKKLFTTLNVDSTIGIEYSGLPVYPTSYEGKTSTEIMVGYGDYVKIFPFFQLNYASAGFDTVNDEYSKPVNSIESLLAPTLDVFGSGIFKTIDVFNYDEQTETLKKDFVSETPNNILKEVTTAKNEGFTKETLFIYTSDNLVQLPIWLDNVNRFRLATTKTDVNDRVDNMTNNWGVDRPLTTTTYELKSPIGLSIGKEGGYTSEQIQNRNLAYLFLAGCKPTPFITSGLISSDDSELVYNDMLEHYPKALIPFVMSQGLIKLPKVWVYGIGATLWRWKMYMGVTTDSNGNITWRHPFLLTNNQTTDNTPIGLDPLAQPGHPTTIFSTNITWDDRNRTNEGGNNRTYTDRIFKDIYGVWNNYIGNNIDRQISCFAASTVTSVGANRSLTGGRENEDNKLLSEYRVTHGSHFDYWGVYNADKSLNVKGLPNEVKYELKNKVDTLSVWVDYWEKNYNRLNPNVGTLRMFQSYKKYSPTDLTFRSAKEASANSYVPLLWITPWQHFYTEPINYLSQSYPKKMKEEYKVTEKTLTFIPMDHFKRDYVGNFGGFGNQDEYNQNNTLLYSNTKDSFDIPINEKFINIGTTTSNVNLIYKTSYQTKIGTPYYVTDFINLEGGRYSDLIALLPTFVKEKFVKEFEDWVDGDWKNTYLKVIDPVNFDETCDSGCLGKSYRFNQFRSNLNLDGVLGEYSTQEYQRAYSDNTSLGILALDKVNSTNKEDITNLENQLFNEYYYAMISTPKLFGLDVLDYNDGNAFYANEILVNDYLNSFIDEFKEYSDIKIDEVKKEEQESGILSDSILDDDDIKLSLYRTFKSITDKWISSTTNTTTQKPNYFFNITDDERPLAAHFSYVNRVMGDIGNDAVLNTLKLNKIPDNPEMSFYNLISDLLGENKFNFFPLPTFTNFTTNVKDHNKVAEEMFSPYISEIPTGGGPNFICMYVGGTSRILDLKPKNKGKGKGCPIDEVDVNFNNDGFSLSDGKINSDNMPIEFTTLSTSQPKTDRIEGGGVTSFKVAYGLENQNMFKSVELDQAEFSETNESLMIIDRLSKQGDPANRKQKGNNLHNIYLTRSYTCKVESLGNMMIQPLQYFDLTNVPMFHGTYLITKVEHNVKPNHVTTNFTGVRQPIATVPVITDVATAFNDSLSDIKPIKGGNVLGVSGGGSGGSGGSSKCSSQPMATQIKANGGDYGNPEKGVNISFINVTSGSGSEWKVTASNPKLLEEAAEALKPLCDHLAKYLKDKGYPGKDGKQFLIASTYRDSNTQEELCCGSVGCYPGKGCKKGVAAPKSSMHELGIAVDFNFYDIDGEEIKLYPIEATTGKIGFESDAYEWLFNNAPYYGFVSPIWARNGGSYDEFWHIEYMGKAAISYMKNNPKGTPWGTSKVFNFVDNGNSYFNFVKNPLDVNGVESTLDCKEIVVNDNYLNNETNNDGTISEQIQPFTNQNEIEKGVEIVNRLVTDLNISREQASGIVGNLRAESSLTPNRIESDKFKVGKITDSGGWNDSEFTNSGSKGYGWAQWTYSSYKNDFIKYAKNKNINLTQIDATDELNYGYLLEWINAKPNKLNILRTKKSVSDASTFFAKEYEKCKNCVPEEDGKFKDNGKEIENRINLAEEIFNKLS